MTRDKIIPLTELQFLATLGWRIESSFEHGDQLVKRAATGRTLAHAEGKIYQKDLAKFHASRGWTPELIEKLLQNNPCACERALLVLWQAQTFQERARSETFVSNDVGFTGADAPRMTELARQVLDGLPLGIAQLRWLRQRAPRSKFSRLGKYHAQLIAAIKRNSPDAQSN